MDGELHIDPGPLVPSVIPAFEELAATSRGTLHVVRDRQSSDELGDIFSDDETYRFLLWRVWRRPEPGRLRLAGWVKHNPSKARVGHGDPTFGRLIAFGRRWEFDGVAVGNLAAFVATDPSHLSHASDPIGRGNRAALDVLLTTCDQVFVGWGNYGTGRIRQIMRGEESVFRARARERAVDLWCVGKTDSGAPKHVLARGKHHVPDNVVPQRWP